jgi:hypothetical protein
MMRLVLIAAFGLLSAACTIDGPPPGRSDPMAEMERQERVRRQTEERQRLCQMIDRESDRYERDCQQAGDRR